MQNKTNSKTKRNKTVMEHTMIRFFRINVDGHFKVKMTVYDKDDNELSITILEDVPKGCLIGTIYKMQ